MFWQKSCNKTSFVSYFTLLLFKPAVGIKKILSDKPSLRLIIYWLFFAGLLRGILETIWLYSIKGHFPQLISSLHSLDWYLLNGGPFIFGNVTSVYFLWTMVALTIFEAGRFLGGKGEFEDILRIYGIFMFSYLIIGILNFVHLFIDIPFIRFSASEIFNPAIGIGQEFVFVWLTVLSYFVVKKVHGLNKVNSALIASLPFSIGIILYILSVALFFRFYELLPDKMGFTPYFLSGLLYIVFNIVLTVVFIKIGYNRFWILKIYKKT